MHTRDQFLYTTYGYYSSLERAPRRTWLIVHYQSQRSRWTTTKDLLVLAFLARDIVSREVEVQFKFSLVLVLLF